MLSTSRSVRPHSTSDVLRTNSITADLSTNLPSFEWTAVVLFWRSFIRFFKSWFRPIHLLNVQVSLENSLSLNYMIRINWWQIYPCFSCINTPDSAHGKIDKLNMMWKKPKVLMTYDKWMTIVDRWICSHYASITSRVRSIQKEWGWKRQSEIKPCGWVIYYCWQYFGKYYSPMSIEWSRFVATSTCMLLSTNHLLVY